MNKTETRSIRVWSILGMISQLLFVASWLLATLWQGIGYSFLRHSISDMYSQGAPFAYGLIIPLVFAGTMVIGFVLFALRPVLSPYGIRGITIVVLYILSVYGLGNLLAPLERMGCRMAEQGCTINDQVSNLGGRLDANITFFGIIFFLIGTAMLISIVRKHKIMYFQKMSMYLGVLLTLFVLPLVLGGFFEDYSGVLEKLLALSGSVILFIVALGIYKTHLPTQVSDKYS